MRGVVGGLGAVLALLGVASCRGLSTDGVSAGAEDGAAGRVLPAMPPDAAVQRERDVPPDAAPPDSAPRSDPTEVPPLRDAAPAFDAGPPPDAAPVIDAAAGPASCGRALMVVGDPQLIATDETVRARLAARMPVDVVAEAEARPEDAAGRALVVITSTVTVEGTGTRFRDVAVPLMLLEPNLMGLMQMTPPEDTAHGATPREETVLTIDMPTHRLAAALSGDVTVYRTPWRLAWGIPGPGAISVAHVAGRPERRAIFAYPARAMMVGLAAPARRLGFFLHDNTMENVTPSAIKLLDAAIGWMIEGITPCPPGG
jgi:hypothetical protein